MAFLSSIVCALPSTSKTSLSCFQLFILLLMMLRLNEGGQDLAQSWNLSVDSFTIHEEMDKHMYNRLVALAKWPDWEELIDYIHGFQ